MHVKVTFQSGIFQFTCECGTFSTSLTNEFKCCHTRLLKNLLEYTDFDYEISENVAQLKFINVDKIISGLKSASAPVILLPSKAGVDRYSVVSNNTCEFVTIFSTVYGKKIIRCNSGLCRSQQANTRSVQMIDSGCHHIHSLKPYIALVENISDPLSSDDENVEDIFEDYDVLPEQVCIKNISILT